MYHIVLTPTKKLNLLPTAFYWLHQVTASELETKSITGDTDPSINADT